jgi:hypothetical protein
MSDKLEQISLGDWKNESNEERLIHSINEIKRMWKELDNPKGVLLIAWNDEDLKRIIAGETNIDIINSIIESVIIAWNLERVL